MKSARYVLLFTVILLLLPTLSPEVGASPTVIDTFTGDVQEATLNFTKGLGNDSLSVDIPLGATILSAEVVLEGVEGTADDSSTLNFTNGNVDTDVWAYYNEGRTIYPLTVNPNLHLWNKAQNTDVKLIKDSDGQIWETATLDPQAGAPPGAYPIQLYRFLPNSAGANNITVAWEGMAFCTMNKTNMFHAEMWLYNHTDSKWIQVTEYNNNSATEILVWMNYTFDLPSSFVSPNGDIDVAIVGTPSEWAGPMIPGFAEGYLYTDYIEVNITSAGGIQYPRDVSLVIDGVEIAKVPGNITDPVTIDETYGFATALQEVLDNQTVKPENITLDLAFFVERPTAGLLNVSGLWIVYEPVVNEAPTYAGPESITIDEDSGWMEIMDLDTVFEDDFNMGLLVFSKIELVEPTIPGPPYPVDFRTSLSPLGNRTLEVFSDPDFFTMEPLEVSITATDLFNASIGGSFSLSVEQKADRPILDLEPILEAHERSPFNHTFAVVDPDLPDDELTFTDDSDYFDVDASTGTLMWTPAPDQIGQHQFYITVTDRFGFTDRIQVTINVENSNDAPHITSALEMDANQDEEASYIITSDDPDVPFGDVLHYMAFADAIEIIVDQNTGRVTFTPTNGQVPSFEITIRVQDQIGEADETVLLVNVANVNDPPVFEDVVGKAYDQNEEVTIQLVVSDPDLDLEPPLRDSLEFTGVGDTMFLPSDDGIISFHGDQSMVGEHTVTYTVTDSGGLSDVLTIAWTIVDVNDFPILSNELPATANEDEEFTWTMVATDIDGDGLAWSDDTDLFDIELATGAISFTPTQAEVGTHTIVITVSDGRGGDLSTTFSLQVVNVNDEPVINTVTPETGSVYDEGEEIQFEAQAADVDGDTLTFVWRKGGKELGTGRSISIDDLPAGTHKIVLEVSDGAGGSVNYDLEVEVQSSAGSSLILPLVLIAVIVAVLVAVMVVRGRSRGASADDVPADDRVKSKKETDKAPSEEMVIDYSSVTTELATEPAPESVLSEDLGSDVDAPSHVAEDATIYNLEDAQEFKVGNGEVEDPKE